MVLSYDGSLAGFFCLAGRALKERIEVNRVIRTGEPISDDLFHAHEVVVSDPAFAARVTAGLKERLGKRFLTHLAHALFSEEPGIEQDLIQLLRHALRIGPKILQHLTDPLVQKIEQAARRTHRERHRLLGLLRFVRLPDDCYLARCTPKANVVPLLGGHFCRRLGDQQWLIIDLSRRLGVWGENGGWQLSEDLHFPDQLPLHDSETRITDLWRTFYHNISNADRFNPRLRQQFLPKYTWSFLTEMQSSDQRLNSGEMLK